MHPLTVNNRSLTRYPRIRFVLSGICRCVVRYMSAGRRKTTFRASTLCASCIGIFCASPPLVKSSQCTPSLLVLAWLGSELPRWTTAEVGLWSSMHERLLKLTSRPGLQCHTAPYSWKLIFECDHQLYEMIMTACTPKEELEWRARLDRPEREECESRCANIHGSLDLNIKSLGTIFGKQGE